MIGFSSEMFCSCRISTDKCLARSLCHSRATCLLSFFHARSECLQSTLTCQMWSLFVSKTLNLLPKWMQFWDSVNIFVMDEVLRLLQWFDTVGGASGQATGLQWGAGIVICMQQKCKWFTCGPADTTVISLSLATLSSRNVTFLVPCYPGSG